MIYLKMIYLELTKFLLPSSRTFLHQILDLLFLACQFSFICLYLYSQLNPILKKIIIKEEKMQMMDTKMQKELFTSIASIFSFILKEEVLL